MKRTALILFIAFIALGLYDFAVVVFTGLPSSISQFIVSTTKVDPIMTFVMGCIVGHLFFNVPVVAEKK